MRVRLSMSLSATAKSTRMGSTEDMVVSGVAEAVEMRSPVETVDLEARPVKGARMVQRVRLMRAVCSAASASFTCAFAAARAAYELSCSCLASV